MLACVRQAISSAPDKDYHKVNIPVCQHNMYKYSPYHVEQEDAATFLVSFPADRLALFAALDVPGLQAGGPKGEDGEGAGVFRPLPSTIRYPAHSEEDSGQPLLCCRFIETPGFSVTDLCNQVYLSNANAFNFDTWFGALENVVLDGAPVTAGAILVELNDSQVAAIARMYTASDRGKYLGHVNSDVFQLARELTKALGEEAHAKMFGDEDNGCFFKLSTRSAKDSKFYKEGAVMAAINQGSGDTGSARPALRRCQARTMRDVVSAMAASERVAQDCEAFLRWRVKAGQKRPLYLVLQPWVEFPAKMEFRCWVFNGKVCGINSVAYPQHIPALCNSEDLRRAISDSAVALAATTHHLLPWESYILDIIYDEASDAATICEYNPWGPHSSTGSQLFSWELDRASLFGVSQGGEGGGAGAAGGGAEVQQRRPEFRVMQPGMRMRSMFDLSIHKRFYQPSDKFLAAVAAATQQCPCCPRPWSARLPPTNVVPYSQRQGARPVYTPPAHAPATAVGGDPVIVPSAGGATSTASIGTGGGITAARSSLHSDPPPQLKMALIVRNDLGMTAGKVAVQCSHATLGCFQKAMVAYPDSVQAWLKSGQMKVALGVDSKQQLTGLQIDAGGRSIPFHASCPAHRCLARPVCQTALGCVERGASHHHDHHQQHPHHTNMCSLPAHATVYVCVCVL